MLSEKIRNAMETPEKDPDTRSELLRLAIQASLLEKLGKSMPPEDFAREELELVFKAKEIEDDIL